MITKILSKKEKTVFLAGAVFLTGALSYTFVLDPVISRSRSLSSDIAAKAAVLKKDTKLLTAYGAVASAYRQRPVIAEGVNEEEYASRIISEAEGLSKRSGCYISGLKPRQSKKIGSYREISIEITVEGDMAGLSRFLHSLEGSKEALKIRQFTISSRSSSSDLLKSTILISKLIAS